ncbi:MAG: hypothetical protein IJ228_03740 [Succinivibrio sp.]|nr:hypothetical protein [Succinivibrio sp.]
MTESKQNEIAELYRQRDSFILIGLTGRTGSGCSTVAKILSRKELTELDLRSYKTCDYTDSEERKYSLIYRFMRQGKHWRPFTVIEASAVIFSFVLDHSFKQLFEFIDYLNDREGRIDDIDELKVDLIRAISDSATRQNIEHRLNPGAEDSQASKNNDNNNEKQGQSDQQDLRAERRKIIAEYGGSDDPISTRLTGKCREKPGDVEHLLYHLYYKDYESNKDDIEDIIKYFTWKSGNGNQVPANVLDLKTAVADKLIKYSIRHYKRDEGKDQTKTPSAERGKAEIEYSGTSSFYSFFMQTIGNNLRAHGRYDYHYLDEESSDTQQGISPQTNLPIMRIISLIRLIKCAEFNGFDSYQGNKQKNNAMEIRSASKSKTQQDKPGQQRTRICIDALRNALEIEYLRDRYPNFYALAINAEDDERQRRLSKKLNEDQIKSLDKIEYPHENTDFYHQNIQACQQIADIHVHNPDAQDLHYFELTKQLIKYIALILQPGLVTPSHLERCMQLAYNAKFNSGCLSRQVGAVVTGVDFSVRSVGWNDVPKGQTPCNLRCVEDYCRNKDPQSFSEFELTDPRFDKALQHICSYINSDRDYKNKMNGKCFAYCFKDIYNTITKEKNQVYTRSLHAEENAFLQIAKYGGAPLEGGKLFTTASPCELCAKKAYQLGIREIYYIDPYPGISKSHILTFGLTGNKLNPKMIFFRGAIGNAYLKLYSPRLPLKDEIALASGLSAKELTKEALAEPKSQDGNHGSLASSGSSEDTTAQRVDRAQPQRASSIKLSCLLFPQRLKALFNQRPAHA